MHQLYFIRKPFNINMTTCGAMCVNTNWFQTILDKVLQTYT